MRRWLAALGALAALAAAGAATAAPQTILFVGNSFTFGAYSPVWRYRVASVTDLNGEGIGGVPALFKLFTQEAGLDYAVSLETSPGKGLDWHWANRLPLIVRPWDHVVLQSFSTLDAVHPGDPALVSDYAARLGRALRAKNPAADLRLVASWARPDLTYPPGKPWSGKPIFAMADDVQAGMEAAAKAAAIPAVIPVGEAFNRAIRTGLADPNPYDGTGPDQIDLWTFDHYHASAYGYYLEALMVFGSVTGRDPESLGVLETAARELGLAPLAVAALQKVAHDELAARSGR